MAKKKRMETLEIEDIHVDEEFQSRADGLDEDQLEQLAEYMKSKGGSVPRISITEVKGIGKILTDGFGRVEASRRAGLKSIQAIVTEGSMLDATLAAASANADQVARRRTNADKRRAVEMLLRRLLDAGQDWSSRKVADSIGVSHPMVERIRAELGGNFTTPDSAKNEDIPLADRKPTRVGRDGIERKVTTPKEEESDWKNVLLADFLKADPYAWECLKDFNVTTAGQLAEKIAAGEKMGLTAIDFKDLMGQVDRLKEGSKKAIVDEKAEPKAKPKEQGEEKGFSLRDFERSLGEVVRNLDDFAVQFQDKNAAEHKQCIKLLTEFEKCFTGWRKRHQPGK